MTKSQDTTAIFQMKERPEGEQKANGGERKWTAEYMSGIFRKEVTIFSKSLNEG